MLRWLPKGTHDYNKFLTPDEITEKLNTAGLTVIDKLGITYNPLKDSWNRSKNMDVNYMLLARRLK